MLTELRNCPNGMLRLVRVKEVEGGRCMRGSDVKVCFIEKERIKSGRIIWKGS